MMIECYSNLNFKKMKYNISINQKAIYDHNLKIDAVDCMILDIIRDMPSFEKVEKKFIGNTVYFWVNHLNLAKENPILGIKTADGIYRRMVKMSDLGLILIHPENQKSKRSYYAISDLYNEIFVRITSDEKPNKDGYFGFKTEVTSDLKPKCTSDEKPKDNIYNIDNRINDNNFPETSFGGRQKTLFEEPLKAKAKNKKELSVVEYELDSFYKKGLEVKHLHSFFIDTFYNTYTQRLNVKYEIEGREFKKIYKIIDSIFDQMVFKSKRNDITIKEVKESIYFFINMCFDLRDGYFLKTISIWNIHVNINGIFSRINELKSKPNGQQTRNNQSSRAGVTNFKFNVPDPRTQPK